MSSTFRLQAIPKQHPAVLRLRFTPTRQTKKHGGTPKCSCFFWHPSRAGPAHETVHFLHAQKMSPVSHFVQLSRGLDVSPVELSQKRVQGGTRRIQRHAHEHNLRSSNDWNRGGTKWRRRGETKSAKDGLKSQGGERDRAVTQSSQTAVDLTRLEGSNSKFRNIPPRAKEAWGLCGEFPEPPLSTLRTLLRG